LLEYLYEDGRGMMEEILACRFKNEIVSSTKFSLRITSRVNDFGKKA
jgi:hypothetical protein